jgi:uncharacterized OB-fold protein
MRLLAADQGRSMSRDQGSNAPRVVDRFIIADENDEFFWRSGADGWLRFLGCRSCGRIHHPPVPRCPYCGARNLAPQAVSGRATVATYTVNHQPFMPGFEPPYVIAMVELEEDPTIRLTTNVVDCAIEDVYIGMPVEVTFEANGEWFVPLFRPRGGDRQSFDPSG